MIFASVAGGVERGSTIVAPALSAAAIVFGLLNVVNLAHGAL